MKVELNNQARYIHSSKKFSKDSNAYETSNKMAKKVFIILSRLCLANHFRITISFGLNFDILIHVFEYRRIFCQY